MNREDMLRLDNQLCFAVYTCAREVTKLYRPLLEELGLTYTQYVTMMALWEKDGVPVKELGERLYLDSGTLTPLLKKLEAAGFVKRTRDVKDERTVIVELTEQGAMLQQKAIDIPAQANCRTGLSEEDLIALREQLKAVVKQIHDTKAETT